MLEVIASRNGREVLMSLCFCGQRLIFHYLQYKKVINLSSKFRRTNYGNSYLQRYYRIHHESYSFSAESKAY